MVPPIPRQPPTMIHFEGVMGSEIYLGGWLPGRFTQRWLASRDLFGGWLSRWLSSWLSGGNSHRTSYRVTTTGCSDEWANDCAIVDNCLIFVDTFKLKLATSA